MALHTGTPDLTPVHLEVAERIRRATEEMNASIEAAYRSGLVVSVEDFTGDTNEEGRPIPQIAVQVYLRIG